MEVCSTSLLSWIIQALVFPKFLLMVFKFFDPVVQVVYPQENIVDYPIIVFHQGVHQSCSAVQALKSS
ncbi:MAG: hypothetical protein NTZ37_01545 [Methanoregula sp.]|nr:hypothetical protein [Methanoregula sp.]